jgi:hypothetical protein
MAAITVAAKGGAMTLAAASGGGDTVASVGTTAGGWQVTGSPVLVATVGANSTFITIDGVAQPAFISGTAVYPLNSGVYPRSIAVTYSQVTGLTVGAAVL